MEWRPFVWHTPMVLPSFSIVVRYIGFHPALGISGPYFWRVKCFPNNHLQMHPQREEVSSR